VARNFSASKASRLCVEYTYTCCTKITISCQGAKYRIRKRRIPLSLYSLWMWMLLLWLYLTSLIRCLLTRIQCTQFWGKSTGQKVGSVLYVQLKEINIPVFSFSHLIYLFPLFSLHHSGCDSVFIFVTDDDEGNIEIVYLKFESQEISKLYLIRNRV